MERTVTRVDSAPAALPKRTRTAAYARVSSGKDTMLHSLSAQVSLYSEMIQRHGDWEYCGVYADEAISGTKEDRENFERLIADCRAGRIDQIITKSVSRFARNTVTLLTTVRELKSLGVDVYFEEQNIHTMSAEGELLLTILASYAQEESRSVSENMRWRIKKNFEEGIPWRGNMLGYRMEDGILKVIPKEAAVVRRIFTEYLDGKGGAAIAKGLNEDGLTTVNGIPWSHTKVMKVLSNFDYTGSLILQKTYKPSHLDHYSRPNKGEKPQYFVEDSHEAIISNETYEAAQRERRNRAERFAHEQPKSRRAYPFTAKVLCPYCGKTYHRKVTATGPVWICYTFNTNGKKACPKAKQIPEGTLMSACANLLELPEFDSEAFDALVSRINPFEGNRLLFTMKDGSEKETVWRDRSRAESWTPEMRAAVGEKHRKGMKQ